MDDLIDHDAGRWVELELAERNLGVDRRVGIDRRHQSAARIGTRKRDS